MDDERLIAALMPYVAPDARKGAPDDTGLEWSTMEAWLGEIIRGFRSSGFAIVATAGPEFEAAVDRMTDADLIVAAEAQMRRLRERGN